MIEAMVEITVCRHAQHARVGAIAIQMRIHESTDPPGHTDEAHILRIIFLR